MHRALLQKSQNAQILHIPPPSLTQTHTHTRSQIHIGNMHKNVANQRETMHAQSPATKKSKCSDLTHTPPLPHTNTHTHTLTNTHWKYAQKCSKPKRNNACTEPCYKKVKMFYYSKTSSQKILQHIPMYHTMECAIHKKENS